MKLQVRWIGSRVLFFVAAALVLAFVNIGIIQVIVSSDPCELTIMPSPTPWVKQDVLIEISSNYLKIWTDNIELDAQKVSNIEGVINTQVMQNGHMIYVRTSPRYSSALIAKDIEGILTLKGTNRRQ